MPSSLPAGLEIEDNTVVRYHGDARVLVIPDGIEAIGYDAFSGCTSLSEITVPATVKRIGHRAFEKCTGLKAVHFNFTEQIVISWSIFFKCANRIKVTFAGDCATFEKNFGPRYDPPEYDMMYGERCAGKWHYPLGHENGKHFICEAYCEADGVTLEMEGRKVDFLGLYELSN
ncbi:MAG: leucine-rich repeat domain-containing protein [Ruminococcaceae bacterium]|nr:leucine-rich repeat domain-containing protein [Oscillospiraceae bacterium]